MEVTHQRALFNRSIFAMVDIYNNLPQRIVDSHNVHEFQSHLTRIVKERCQRGDPAWMLSFSRRGGPDLDGPVIS